MTTSCRFLLITDHLSRTLNLCHKSDIGSRETPPLHSDHSVTDYGSVEDRRSLWSTSRCDPRLILFYMVCGCVKTKTTHSVQMILDDRRQIQMQSKFSTRLLSQLKTNQRSFVHSDKWKAKLLAMPALETASILDVSSSTGCLQIRPTGSHVQSGE